MEDGGGAEGEEAVGVGEVGEDADFVGIFELGAHCHGGGRRLVGSLFKGTAQAGNVVVVCEKRCRLKRSLGVSAAGYGSIVK